jgi:putative ABC transport system permease protein
VGRLTPSFGLPDLKISKRQMLSSKPRGAITLLALVVGVFALSTITFYAQSFTNLLDAVVEAVGNETVWAMTLTDGQLPHLEEAINDTENVESYTVMRMYSADLQRIERTNGEVIRSSDFPDNLREQFGQVRGFYEDELREQDFIAGGQLTGPGQIVIRDSGSLRDLNIRVGDKLTFNFGERRNLTETLEIGGITRAPAASPVADVFGDNRMLISPQLEAISPEFVGYTVSMPEDEVWKLSQRVNETTFAFVLDLRLVSNLVEALIDEFEAFPTLVAILGLIVGGVVIANSVALSTMERRREIAVMKAVGLRRERVLGMLLLENGLLGLVGGLIGVGFGLAVLVGVSVYFDLPLEAVPYLTGFGLMGLCVLVALSAALTTAWGASGEKPLNVLRYEE